MGRLWAGLALPAVLLAGCSQPAETVPLHADEIYEQALFGWCIEQLGGEPLVENTLDPTEPPWELYVGTEGARLYSARPSERQSPEVHISLDPEPSYCEVLSGLGSERIGFVDQQIQAIPSLQVVAESTEGRESRIVYQVQGQPLQIEIRQRRRENEQGPTVLDATVTRVDPEQQEQA
jgi:hypothetical protein